MPWYCFYFGRSSKTHGNSLARQFAQIYSAQKEPHHSRDGFFTAKLDLAGHASWYYLYAADAKVYKDLIHHFGGKICVPPPSSTLQHLAGEWLVPGGESEVERRESLPQARSFVHRDGTERKG